VVDSPVEMDGEVLHGVPSCGERPGKFKVRLDSGSDTIAFTRGRRLFRRKLTSGDRIAIGTISRPFPSSGAPGREPNWPLHGTGVQVLGWNRPALAPG